MLESLRRYAGLDANTGDIVGKPSGPTYGDAALDRPQDSLERDNRREYRSLLILLEAELVVATVQLTGNEHIDFHIKNRIAGLEIQIAGIRTWLTQD